MWSSLIFNKSFVVVILSIYTSVYSKVMGDADYGFVC